MRHDYCDNASKGYFSTKALDAMTNKQIAWVIAHNEHYEKTCG